MELETTRIFVKVAQLGSFSKAAAALGMPVSSVSRAVRKLEDEVATTLLQRTTRALRLTAGGQAFFESCVGPVQLLEDARRSLQGADSIISGRVKITAPEDLGGYAVTPVLADLSRKHPALSFSFHYTDEVVDLIAGGYDLAVRLGPLSPSRFKARKLGEVALIAVASPRYLAGKATVSTLRDLSSNQHDLLSFEGVGFPGNSSRVTGNMMESLVVMACKDAGIALVPRYLCRKELDQGKLVRVLPDWATERYTVSLISAAPAQMPARVKIVADELARSIRAAIA